MPKLIFVGGPPGVGKSAAARRVFERVPGSAWLDGDDVWRMNPFAPDDARRRMVERNISFVLRGFLEQGFETVILSWVLHRMDLVDRLVESLDGLEFELRFFVLLCSEDRLRSCIAGDPGRTTPVDRAAERLRQCAALPDAERIDTDALSADGVAERIVSAL